MRIYLDFFPPKKYTWWRHQMETFPALLAICAWNSPVPGEFPAQRPVTRSFDVFFLICVWINGWVNNGEAGDMRRYRAHYDVTVMCRTHQRPTKHLMPRQNGRRFADIFIFCMKIAAFWFKFHGNVSALAQILTWHRTGDKPLSELMMA